MNHEYCGYLRFTDDTVAMLEHAMKVLGRINRILYAA